jgi:cystathionine gamma-synthase
MPKKIAITGGYHGVHNVIDIYKRGRDVEIVDVDTEDFTGVDLCWIETPLNPTGEAKFVVTSSIGLTACLNNIVIFA